MTIKLEPLTRACVQLLAGDTVVGHIRFEDNHWLLYTKLGMGSAELKQLSDIMLKFEAYRDAMKALRRIKLAA